MCHFLREIMTNGYYGGRVRETRALDAEFTPLSFWKWWINVGKIRTTIFKIWESWFFSSPDTTRPCLLATDWYWLGMESLNTVQIQHLEHSGSPDDPVGCFLFESEPVKKKMRYTET
jgi:hypothetical protein